MGTLEAGTRIPFASPTYATSSLLAETDFKLKFLKQIKKLLGTRKKRGESVNIKETCCSEKIYFIFHFTQLKLHAIAPVMFSTILVACRSALFNDGEVLLLKIVHGALGLWKQCCNFPVSDEKINYCTASGWLMFTHLDTWSKKSFPFITSAQARQIHFVKLEVRQNISHANFNWKLWRELCRSEKTLKSRDCEKLSSLRAEMREKCQEEWKKSFFF